MAIDRVAGVVLAGGLSRRLGRDKAVEVFDREPLVHRVIGRLSELVDEVVVVANNSERAGALPLPDGVKTAVDIYPDTGSLGGIFTGVSFVESEWSIVVACDMPFLNMDLFTHMLTLCPDQDVVVPPNSLLEAKDFLMRNKVDIEIKMIENCGHHISVEASSIALNYIKKNLYI